MSFLDLNRRSLEQVLLSRLSSKEVKNWLGRYAQPYRELMAYYRCAMKEVSTKFEVLNEEFSLQYDHNPIETVKTRLKSPDSILDKLTGRQLPLTVESIEQNLSDVAGVRVICSFPSDIYMLADSFLRQDDITLIRRKDYIKEPKENGYRSLHLIVAVPIFLTDQKKMMNVEIQLRTIAMDFWASLEHQLRYKKEHLFTPEMADDLKICADVSTELDTLMNNLAIKIHEQENPHH